MNKPVKLRYVNQLVGSLLLAVAVLLLVVLFLVFRQQGWFDTSFQLVGQLTEQQVNGLHQGTEVLLLGQQVGQVSQIAYAGDADQHDKILVKLELRRDPDWPIYEGSVAYVQRRLAGAGEAYLEIRRLKASDKLLEDGDMIAIETEAEAGDKLGEMVDAMWEIRSDFAQVRESMTTAFTRMDSALGDLQASNERAQTVISDLQQFSPKLSPLADQARDVLDTSQSAVETIRQETNDLPGTVNQFRSNLATAQEALDAVRSHWLLRRYVTQPPDDPTIEPAEVGRGEIWP